MYLEDIYKGLLTSEFSQLDMGTIDEGEILELCEEDKVKLFPSIERGLIQLFKRFRLKQSTTVIQMVSGQETYNLKEFVSDIIKIEEVFGSDQTKPLPLNKKGVSNSLSTPNMTSLCVPLVLIDQPLQNQPLVQVIVHYQAAHKILEEDSPYMASGVELELPDEYINAICYFVASCVFNPMGMQQEHHSGNYYASKYEEECQRLQGEGLQIDTNHEISLFTANGFT